MTELPTLSEMLAKQFVARVENYTQALRHLAGTLEHQAIRLGTQPGLRKNPITAVETVANMQHEIEWGLANANFASVVTAAADYDRGGDNV